MPVKEYTNRLINEKSPYLLQHAHNPVDWYPWGDEAFAKAKAEDKPVFLSIGYSTCHWCHVMERESFEDEEVAELLNHDFISIKVDREERPDVDHFYMNACAALNGQGGWPLSCFLTADRDPFYIGTYFPKNDRYSMPGFISILRHISRLWKNSRSEILDAGQSIVQHLKSDGERKSTKLSENVEEMAFNQLKRSFDSKNGGFGGAPKFPSLQNLLFLMRYGIQYSNKSAFEMVSKTLERMRSGGIYDHIGGGFCRYSTDDIWLVPHFEKMMYDNALHIMTYSEAGSVLNTEFSETAREVAEFCLREMRDKNGGFYTALDADSEGVEGKYYVFTPEDITKVLGEADSKRYCELYHISSRGNFEGKNIPNLIQTKLSDDDRVFARLSNEKLRKFRSKRIPPFKDDKITVLNNGLMIAALAESGRLLGNPHYVAAAINCADFILNNLLQNGRLMSRFREEKLGPPATSDDYAYLVWGLIELYESTFEPVWLQKALQLTDQMIELFGDENGVFFLSGKDVNDLPVRQKNLHDGAIPSGNAVASLNMLRLSRITGNQQYENNTRQMLDSMAQNLNNYPSAFCGFLSTLVYMKNGGSELILVNGNGMERLKKRLTRFLPFTVSAVCGEGYNEITCVAPFLENYHPVNGQAAVYLCRNGACLQPVTDARDLEKLLDTEGEK